jgi:hypothetical protein
MNVKKLKEVLELLEDDTEVLVWDAATERIYETNENCSIDTNMRTGEIVFMVLATDKEAGNVRDFEPHPGFEDTNAWAFE